MTKTTALLCKMWAAIAMLSTELQRLKSGAATAAAKPEGGGLTPEKFLHVKGKPKEFVESEVGSFPASLRLGADLP